jgi:uncharacterized protein YlxW (UPF0749 family)
VALRTAQFSTCLTLLFILQAELAAKDRKFDEFQDQVQVVFTAKDAEIAELTKSLADAHGTNDKEIKAMSETVNKCKAALEKELRTKTSLQLELQTARDALQRK